VSFDPSAAKILREALVFDRTRQSGVVALRQLQQAGWTEVEVRRSVRRREVVRVLPRVYVDHTGPLTAEQRAWAALLWAEPAALCGDSVLGVAPDAESVHVAIDRSRSMSSAPGVTIHRLKDVESLIRVGTSPPRLALEHNVMLTLAEAGNETDVVAALTSTVGRLGTTAKAVRRAVENQPRLRHRSLVLALLDDIENGTESVLEHGFLTRVERPHGLPTPIRQAVRRDGKERRDLDYPDFGLVIELDGRLNHESWRAGNRDAARDLADVSSGNTVLRLRWEQVMVSSCETAALLGNAMASPRVDGHGGSLSPVRPHGVAERSPGDRRTTPIDAPNLRSGRLVLQRAGP
jgi:hypothetical protein